MGNQRPTVKAGANAAKKGLDDMDSEKGANAKPKNLDDEDSELASENDDELDDFGEKGIRQRHKSTGATMEIGGKEGKADRKIKKEVISQEMKQNFEQATKIFQDINMNAALLEKLKQELVGLKTRYAENQMELASVGFTP